MKAIKNLDPIYLEQYDVKVNPHLTYAQIQAIVNSLSEVGDTWAERQQNIDMLILAMATDMKPEELEEIGHETLLRSGLIDMVRRYIYNMYDLETAIKYHESTERAVKEFGKALKSKLDSIDMKELEKYAGLQK